MSTAARRLRASVVHLTAVPTAHAALRRFRVHRTYIVTGDRPVLGGDGDVDAELRTLEPLSSSARMSSCRSLLMTAVAMTGPMATFL
jgi:hypothetical protein